MDFDILVNNYKDEIIRSTQELVRIKSVEEEKTSENAPFGDGVRKALDNVIKLCSDLGFKVEDFDGYAAHADLGDQEETVGVLAHIDVVPEGDGWKYPPYAAEIHDDKIYGRGTMDDKGPAIAVVYAMKILKDLDVKLSRKIRIIFGANEETGWKCMDHYFSIVEPPTMAFTPDANFPVIYGEKGILVFDLEKDITSNDGKVKVISLKGGNAPNMVPDLAVVELDLTDGNRAVEIVDKYIDNGYDIEYSIEGSMMTIKANGVSAHGSTPEVGKNAISYLLEVLEDILEDGNSFKEFAKFYNEKIGFNVNGENIGCGLEDDISGKLNFNVGVIKVEDEKIILTSNIRYPIKSSEEEVYNGINSSISGLGINLIKKSSQEPLYVPEDNFLVEQLMNVYREETNDESSKPITIGGGTYARAIDNAVAFGPVFPGQVELAHQKNEFIEIDHLLKLVTIYTKALYNLAK